jgi:hypothetical protein
MALVSSTTVASIRQETRETAPVHEERCRGDDVGEAKDSCRARYISNRLARNAGCRPGRSTESGTWLSCPDTRFRLLADVGDAFEPVDGSARGGDVVRLRGDEERRARLSFPRTRTGTRKAIRCSLRRPTNTPGSARLARANRLSLGGNSSVDGGAGRVKALGGGISYKDTPGALRVWAARALLVRKGVTRIPAVI